MTPPPSITRLPRWVAFGVLTLAAAGGLTVVVSRAASPAPAVAPNAGDGDLTAEVIS